MINYKRNRALTFIKKLINHSSYNTKVRIYFSTKSFGDDYDPYEAKATYTNLNPLTIKAYVREISPEALVWKQYGLQNMGAKELLCEDKYKNYFENCNKLEIAGVDYFVFKEGTGNKTLIIERPNKLLRVIITKSE